MNIKQRLTELLLLMIFSLMAINVPAQIPASPQSQPIALVNGTIHPITNPVIENGTILFRDGKIVDLGSNITIPANAVEVDVAGKHVYPGMIESVSQLGLTEIGAVRATRDMAEMGDINPNVRAEVAVDPESEHFPVARANGIALAITIPTGGIICGQSALLEMDGWTWEDMTVKAPVSMGIDWPRMRVYKSRWIRISEKKQRERMKEQLQTVKQAFKDARAYMKAKEAAGKKGVPFHKFDPRWEAMIPVLKGELPVWIEANSLLEIEAAISWAQQENLKIVLVGGLEAYRADDLLKQNDIPVIVTSTFRMPGRRDGDFDEPFTLPKKLHDAGVKFCIACGGASNVRNLPYHAAKAVSYGLPKDEALKAITLYPAQIIGVADQVGSLEKGKDATLMVTTGDPLEITTHVEKLYIQGRDIDLSNKHKQLYSKYKEKYRQLEGR